MKAKKISQKISANKGFILAAVAVAEIVMTTVGFVLLHGKHIITAYGEVLAIIAFVALIICIFIQEKEVACMISYVLVALLILITIEHTTSFLDKRQETAHELYSDITESIILDYQDKWREGGSSDFLLYALNNDDCVIFYVPNSTDLDIIYDKIIDEDKRRFFILNGEYENGSIDIMKGLGVEYEGHSLFSKYNLVLAYTPILKDDWSNCKEISLVPSHVYLTIRTFIDQYNDNYKKGYVDSLALADSLGNAFACYLLYLYYSEGHKTEPDLKLAHIYLNKAANTGSRLARVILGEEHLNNRHASSYEKAIGIDLLKRAASLSSVATKSTVENAKEALSYLNKYYTETGQFKEAYKLTKNYINTFYDYDYAYHVDNCIKREYYKEALSYISKGESERNAHCYYVHAEMLAKGLGVPRDIHKAEILYRFASDSLNYWPAYKGLYELFRDNECPQTRDTSFWKQLYTIKFSNRIGK